MILPGARSCLTKTSGAKLWGFAGSHSCLKAAAEPYDPVKISIRNCEPWRVGVKDDSGRTGRWTAVSRGALAIAGMAAAWAACWPASAAELTTTLSKENRTIVVLSGELARGDANHFKDILKTSAAAGTPVSAVRLNSRGGSLIEGVTLAFVIQRAKIATVIASGATCLRACFIPFIAGSQKVVSTTATVAGPGAKPDYQPSGNTPALVRAEIPTIVQVVQKLGLLDAIVTKMQATPEDDTFTLSPDDLRAMGATVTGKPVPAAAVEQVKKPGS
jgi:hypothetical protein